MVLNQSINQPDKKMYKIKLHHSKNFHLIFTAVSRVLHYFYGPSFMHIGSDSAVVSVRIRAGHAQ